MKSNAYSALMLSLVLVLSSLAGCLSADEEEQEETENEVLGKVMVSTYHVGELVSTVAGDTLDVEIISPSNVPVHDYEPSAGDLIRLQESDLFFYHGVNLEPWVESALATLGNDAPVSTMTHTMPSGEVTLDYESILISDLCELLVEGPFESTALGMPHDDHDDLDDHDDDHDDHDDDHDDHDDDHDDHDDDHDDHSDDEDDHDDDHDDHEMMKMITTMTMMTTQMMKTITTMTMMTTQMMKTITTMTMTMTTQMMKTITTMTTMITMITMITIMKDTNMLRQRRLYRTQQGVRPTP